MFLKQKSFKKFLVTTATAAMLATAVVPTASASTHTFSDVPEFYQDAVSYLIEKDITNGIGNEKFGTEDQIKRADAALMIARALGLESHGAPDSGFEDVPEYAKNAVDMLKFLGIVNGKSETSFGGYDSLTRAEMAKMIAGTFDEIPVEGPAHPFVDVEPIYNDYVQALYHAGITNGTGATTFGSNDFTTRGQFAIFLAEAKQLAEHAPEVVVYDLTGEVQGQELIIRGNAEEIEKVKIDIQTGNEVISLETNVVNNQFTVTTTLPENGIDSVTVLDMKGNVLYEGVPQEAEVSAASINRTFNFVEVKK